MTITNGYCTRQQLANSLSMGDGPQYPPDYSDNFDRSINAASRWIDNYCGRFFYSTTTTFVFRPISFLICPVTDICSSAGVAVVTDTSDVGTFNDTWQASDYELEPVGLTGDMNLWAQPGGVYTQIRAVRGKFFPIWARHTSVQVTATFGWNAVPDAVTQAAVGAAAYIFKTKDAPFGTAGIADIGLTRAVMPPVVTSLLAPYRRFGAPGGFVVA